MSPVRDDTVRVKVSIKVFFTVLAAVPPEKEEGEYGEACYTTDDTSDDSTGV